MPKKIGRLHVAVPAGDNPRVSRDNRVAHNEGLLRDVNDRIEEVMERWDARGEGPGAPEADFLCECGDSNCTETVRLTFAAYEDVRRDEAQFVVFPGHEKRDVEDVVAQPDGYRIVRKHPAEAGMAEETDPHRH
jgi:hypothetical protein